MCLALGWFAVLHFISYDPLTDTSNRSFSWPDQPEVISAPIKLLKADYTDQRFGESSSAELRTCSGGIVQYSGSKIQTFEGIALAASRCLYLFQGAQYPFQCHIWIHQLHSSASRNGCRLHVVSVTSANVQTNVPNQCSRTGHDSGGGSLKHPSHVSVNGGLQPVNDINVVGSSLVRPIHSTLSNQLLAPRNIVVSKYIVSVYLMRDCAIMIPSRWESNGTQESHDQCLQTIESWRHHRAERG